MCAEIKLEKEMQSVNRKKTNPRSWSTSIKQVLCPKDEYIKYMCVCVFFFVVRKNEGGGKNMWNVNVSSCESNAVCAIFLELICWK